MGVMNYWFFKRPGDYEKDQAFYYFRMMEPDFYPHPVYDALKEQAMSPPILGLGYHQEDHWALTYAGSWEAVEDDGAVLGTYREGDRPGDSLTFTFWGTELSLVLAGGENSGRLEAVIDGRPVEGNVTNSLHDGGLEIPVVGGLAEGEHEVRLTIVETDEGGSRVAIDGLIVRRTPLFLIRRGLSLLILLGLAVLIFFVAWRRGTRRDSSW